MKKNILLVILTVVSFSTVANPGRFQINQACLDVGCFSGDNPATTTVEITHASGTFVLTSDLVFDGNLDGVPAILVSRPGNNSAVTIDLNGFEIRYVGTPTTNTNGINVVGENSIVGIRNGRIISFSDGVNSVDAVTVHIRNMVFQDNTDDGVQAPLGSIRQSTFDNNGFSIFAVTATDQFDGDRLIIEGNQFFGVDQGVFSIGSSNLCKDNMVGLIGSNSNLGSCTLTGLNLCGNSGCTPNAINNLTTKD